jgi:hypothetical protein
MGWLDKIEIFEGALIQFIWIKLKKGRKYASYTKIEFGTLFVKLDLQSCKWRSKYLNYITIPC